MHCRSTTTNSLRRLAHAAPWAAVALLLACGESSVNPGGSVATALAILAQPSTDPEDGEPFPEQPVIQLRDANDAPVEEEGVEVTAELASGTGELNGSTTVTTDATGVATFTDLLIDGHGDHTIRFTAPDLTEVVSNTITLPGPVIATRYFRVIHAISNYPGPVDICVRLPSGPQLFPEPVNHTAYPNGIPYGTTTDYFPIATDIETSILYEFHQAPLAACPAPGSGGASLLETGSIGWSSSQVQFEVDGSHWSTGPLGTAAVPPGDPVSVCGPNLTDPCTENEISSGFWADDLPSVPVPPPGEISLRMTNLLVGGDFVTVCWDGDGGGPGAPVLLADFEAEGGRITDRRSAPPLATGTILVFSGGGVDCATEPAANAATTLTVPDASPLPGAVASLPDGSVGQLIFIGQINVVPSSPQAAPRVVLLLH